MTDPIADMLTRIRNAQAVKKTEVAVPFSKFKYNLAQVLAEEGWLVSVEENSADKNNFRELRLKLKYHKSGRPVIMSLRRVSKPGRRVYVDYEHLPRVLNGLGVAVVSTSHGLMTNKEARRAKIGGEIICEIY